MKTPSILSNSSASVSASVLTASSVLAAALALGASTGVSAANSSPADVRGYQTCVKALDTSTLSGVVFPRVYYIAHQSENKIYYLNASAWENGERVVKRITCETSNSGRQVNSFATANGQFALAADDQLRVAGR